jgi:hypothetical protein
MRIQGLIIFTMVILLTKTEIARCDNSGNEICGDWAYVKIGEYAISNNVWNKRDIKEYMQCIRGHREGSNSFGSWRWKWPKLSDEVKAYPEIIYGWKPWEKRSTTEKLPIALAKLQSITVDYDTSSSAEGARNLAFDIWITNSGTPKEQSITDEIMVWVDNVGLTPGGTYQEEVVVEDRPYRLYHGKAGHASWRYTAFVPISPMPSAKLRIDSFLSYLITKGILNGKEFLASIEFGNEIVSGQGKTDIGRFSINLQATR